MTSKPAVQSLATDTYAWANPDGGGWGTAANWFDTNTGTIATTAPVATSPASITGGSAWFTNIAGTGAASQLAIANQVLLWGTLAVGGTVALAAGADLELDGGAGLTAGGLMLAPGTELEAGNGSSVSIGGVARLTGGFLGATNGSIVQLGALIASNGPVFQTATATIAVDS